MNKYSLSLLVVIFSTASLYSAKSYAENFYEVVDLGKFEEGSSGVFAYDIIDNQTIVGYSTIDQTTGLSRGFSFNEGDVNLTDLGAIDNTEVLVEITNTVGGDEQTTIENVGTDSLDPPTPTSSFIFSLDDNTAVGYSLKIFGSVNSSTNADTGIVTERAVGTAIERAIYINLSNQQISEIPDFIDGTPTNMRALSINNNYIVGTGKFNEPGDDTETSFDRGFIYEISSGELLKINPLNNVLTHFVTLRDIDATGFAVGISAEKIRGVIFNRKVVGVDLSSPEDVVEYTIFGTTSQEVSAINNMKKIVGRAIHANGKYRTAYLYDINTNVSLDLGVLNTNFPSSEAYDINDSDQIVGISQIKNKPAEYSGFIYENGEMKNLTELIGCDTGWRIHEARSINNNGFITGTGFFNGEARAFMLRPLAGTAPICEDKSLNLDGGGSPSLISLFTLFGLLGLRRRYLILNSSNK